MNFVAVDVETANADLASICAIGVVEFRAGAAGRSVHYLVDPEDEFDPVNTAIHGIDEHAILGAPKLSQVMPILAKVLADTVVVHHTHFDRVALSQASTRFGAAAPACRWLDSARVARRTWDWCADRGYGLASIAEHLGIAFRHHFAEDDARVAGEIVLRASRHTGLTIEQWFARVEQPIDLSRDGKRVRLSGDPSGVLYGENIAFTGALTMARVDAAQVAAKAGCNVQTGVTKDTTILVVGQQDIRVVGAAMKSIKHKKAEQLIARGQNLRIIGEHDFLSMIRRSV